MRQREAHEAALGNYIFLPTPILITSLSPSRRSAPQSSEDGDRPKPVLAGSP